MHADGRLTLRSQSVHIESVHPDLQLKLDSGTNNIGEVNVASIAAGETHIGEISTADTVIDLTATLDTAAYASGDVLFDTQEVAGAARVTGGTVTLQNITIIDEDDQGVAFDFYFLNANNSLGTENAAPSISDTNARNILGYVAVATTDYKDLGGVKIATIRNLGLVMKAASGATSLYVGAVNGTGTPTFTASGLKFKLGFLR